MVSRNVKTLWENGDDWRRVQMHRLRYQRWTQADCWLAVRYKYTLIHMTRYAGRHRGRIWNNVSAKSVNWLSGHHGGCIGRSYIPTDGFGGCSKKNVHNWTLVSDQFNYTRVEQAGGATTARKIKNREYSIP
jgi:hypothetical protein